jgi:hypothetical protein
VTAEWKLDYLNARKKVRQRDGWLCHYCGQRCTSSEGTHRSTGVMLPLTRTIDHVVGQYYHGPNTIDNMVVACNWCNQGKKNKAWPDHCEFCRLAWEKYAPDQLTDLRPIRPWSLESTQRGDQQ